MQGYGQVRALQSLVDSCVVIFKVRNAVVDVVTAMKVVWSPESVNTIGEEHVKQVRAALWYFDPHDECLSSRSVHLEFQPFYGFNDWQ